MFPDRDCLNAGCVSLSARLLRSLILGTVEGGGLGSKGSATMRRGGD
jgi:hypothetical protein